MTTENKMMLSLVLTTIDRHNFLAERIREWEEQFAGQADIQGIILDASATTYKDTLPEWIEYHWMPGKRGLFHDYMLAFRKARGQYVWFWTDDDELAYCDLSALRRQLKEVDLLLIPQRVVGDSGKHLSDTLIDRKHRNTRRPLSLITPSEIQHLSHIGSFIFHRSLWCEKEARLPRKNYFPHLFPIFTRRNLCSLFVVTDAVLLRVVVGRASWLADTASVWLEHWPVAMRFLYTEGYGPSDPLATRKIILIAAMTSTKKVKSILTIRQRLTFLEKLMLSVPQIILNFLYKLFLLIKRDPLASYEFKTTKSALRRTQ